MSWYYATGGAQQGPVDDEALAALVRAGTITSATLVWREGMADWRPYAEVATPPPNSPPAGGMVACAECSRSVPATDTIVIDGRTICATCKPIVVQRIAEGADSGGREINPDELLARIRAAGGYRLEIGSAISRGFDVVKRNFWPSFGITLLLYVILTAVSQVPCVGPIAQLVGTGPVMGGLLYYFLLQVRGRPATINEAFAGFRAPRVTNLMLGGLIITLITMLVAVVIIGPAFFIYWESFSTNTLEPLFFVWIAIAMIPVMLLSLIWYPAYVIIGDTGMNFWAAMELSRKLVMMRFLSWVGFAFVNFFMMMAGVLFLCLGVFAAMAISLTAMCVVWQDILDTGTDRAAPSLR